jgi:hypothetical protein
MYCTVEEALSLVPRRAITTTSKPTTMQVEGYVIDAEGIINLKMKASGIDPAEVSGPEYELGLKAIAKRIVAGMVETALKVDDGSEQGEQPNVSFYKEGMSLLNDFCKNYKLNPTQETGTVIQGITGREDELEAQFHRNEREW